MTDSRFHKIIVIQVLKENELQTGRKLEEDIYDLKTSSGINISTEIHSINNKKDFIKQMALIEEHCRKGQYIEVPFLHIESHGADDKTGMVFPNGDFISWLELSKHITNINIATRFNLFVILSMCHSAHFIQAIDMAKKRAPCLGFIGSTSSVKAGVLLDDMREFYANIFQNSGLIDSPNAFKKEINRESGSYLFVNCIYWINELTEHMKTKMQSNHTSRKWAKNIRKRMIKHQKKLNTNNDFNLPSLKYLQHSIKTDGTFFANEVRKHFLMLDFFPENEKRFIQDANVG